MPRSTAPAPGRARSPFYDEDFVANSPGQRRKRKPTAPVEQLEEHRMTRQQRVDAAAAAIHRACSGLDPNGQRDAIAQARILLGVRRAG